MARMAPGGTGWARDQAGVCRREARSALNGRMAPSAWEGPSNKNGAE